MSRIISIANQKGGVGKTTTSVNLAACLAAAGKKVLLLDLDPQGNATSGIGFNKDELSPTVYEMLIQKATPLETIRQHPFINNLYLIPSNIELVGAHNDLHQNQKKYFRLKHALQELRNKNSFDYILIDCPPSLGVLTINALIASHDLLIPIQSEYYAMEGVSLMVKTLQKIRQKANTSLNLFGVVLTMYDVRTNLSRQVEEEIRKHFSDRVFKTVIPRSIRLGEAPSHGMPIILYELKSAGSQAYIQLTEEVLERYGRK